MQDDKVAHTIYLQGFHETQPADELFQALGVIHNVSYA